MLDIIARVKNDRYIHFIVDITKRKLIFISAIPELEREELVNIANYFGYTIHLEITSETILPMKQTEYEAREDLTTVEFLSLFLTALNETVSMIWKKEK